MNNASTSTVDRNEDEVVRAHLPLVRRAVADLVARLPLHAPRDDLMSAGFVGLVQAVRNYDPTRGVPFASYAASRIRGALLDELRAHDWASRPVRAKARAVGAATERLAARLGRMPTTPELAHEVGVDPASLHTLADDVHRATVVNYDALVRNGEAHEVLLVDEEHPELELLDRERHAYLFDAVDALPPRLRTVVVRYFFEGRTMQEIGDELGVGESRVSQLRSEALELLRDGINSHLEPSMVPQFSRPDGRVARRKRAYFEAIGANSTPSQRLAALPRRPLTACA